jgi:restriction system protein
MVDNELQVWGIHAGRPRGASDAVHRALEEETDRLFSSGVIAIGWPEVGDLRELTCDRDSFKQRLRETNPSLTPGAVAIDATTLLVFACEARVGDIVVWRPRLRTEVRIGRITSDYLFEPDSHEEYVHRRRVSWARLLRPTDFSDSARRAVGQQRSFFPIKNHQHEFLERVAVDRG